MYSLDEWLDRERARATSAGLDLSASDSDAPPLGDDERLRRVAQSDLPVLILGETGAGKERLASRIHAASPRASRPFLKLNCAALTPTLLESELFGHERGAFTGAHQAKAGLLESASGGSVFLDEVGDTPAPMQAKLLRAVEEHQVLRVGGVKPVRIDVRFIAATNRDLEAEVRAERFRADLYFRLEGALFLVPPLRERPREFDDLVFELLDERSRLAALPFGGVSRNALALLRGYHWPGNVRELRNVLDRAVWLARGATIRREHLPVDRLTRASVAPTFDHRRRTVGRDDEANVAREREALSAALTASGGNQSAAARLLGVSRQLVVRRIAALGLRSK